MGRQAGSNAVPCTLSIPNIILITSDFNHEFSSKKWSNRKFLFSVIFASVIQQLRSTAGSRGRPSSEISVVGRPTSKDGHMPGWLKAIFRSLYET